MKADRRDYAEWKIGDKIVIRTIKGTGLFDIQGLDASYDPALGPAVLFALRDAMAFASGTGDATGATAAEASAVDSLGAAIRAQSDKPKLPAAPAVENAAENAANETTGAEATS